MTTTKKISGASWTPPEDTTTDSQREKTFLVGAGAGLFFTMVILAIGTLVVPVVQNFIH